jgi:hypothetical protein
VVKKAGDRFLHHNMYTEMLAEDRLDVTKAARGLHIAVQKVKNETRQQNGKLDPMAWVPYIHVGA